MKSKISGYILIAIGLLFAYGALRSQYCLPDFRPDCGLSPEPGNIFGIVIGVLVALGGVWIVMKFYPKKSK